MRLYLKTTASNELIPFNYQPYLVGAFHKWLGDNQIHDDISLYSLSWLNGAEKQGKGLKFSSGAVFFISSPYSEIIKQIIAGVRIDPSINFGLSVREITIQQPPTFGERERFFLNSPILIKRRVEEKIKFFFPEDEDADLLMTETLRNKLEKAGLGELPVRASFDRTYQNIKTKLVNYNSIKNKATFCPIILEGSPRAIAFAWEVGIGNSTGIGFGALK